MIAYYLERRELLDAYMRNREAEAAELRAELEARQPLRVIRVELLRRRKHGYGATCR